MKLISILLALSISLSSCITTQETPIKDFTKEALKLPCKIENIEIIDGRDTLLSMNWNLPTVATKKRSWKANPELSELNKADINRIIKRAEDPNGIPANIKFTILEGVCELNADWKSIKEYASFKGIMLFEIPSKNTTYKSTAEMHFEYPTVNGSRERLMKLYNQAVRNATHMAVKQISSEIKL
jgi:hypothetical protein